LPSPGWSRSVAARLACRFTSETWTWPVAVRDAEACSMGSERAPSVYSGVFNVSGIRV
jgi:hypothetical protein